MSCVGRSGGVFAVLVVAAAVGVRAQTVTGGAREIMLVNFASAPVGDFPKRNDLSTSSSLEVVDNNGVHMLKAVMPSEFVITLPETLPDAFTVEFDVIPKESADQDLGFDGSASRTGSTSFAKVIWSPLAQQVTGGGTEFHATTQQGLPGQLNKLIASFEGSTLKLYATEIG